MNRLTQLGMGILGIVWWTQAAFACVETPTQGGLCAILPNNQGTVEVPLKHTEVKAEISGLVASVEVTQTFTNPYQDVIEAIYVFPLPENAAVNDMVMTIGDRTIRGLIKERQEAQKIYDDAKAKGHVASLLTQERPNIFTQAVANIEPGKEILITIRYLQDLKYDRGEYEFVFPMVVGPRYIPGTPVGKQAGGWSPDTDRVPDASRITPPVLKPGTRSGHDIKVTVKLDAGVPIQGIHSTSHQVDASQLDAHRAEITLHPLDTIPNKDFIVRYAVAGKKPEMALLTHRGEFGGYFLLMIQPQADFNAGEITPKEMLFVLDTSGSMSGEPIAKVKQAMRKALMSMNPDDTFQIIQFNSGLQIFPEKPLTNTRENVQRALSYINGIDADGGTEMLPAINAALTAPHDPKRLRIVCLMTDGYIGNEREIFAAVQQHAGTARVFSFGVGSSVNRYLVTQAATLGRGEAQVIRHDEPTDEAVQRFYDRIARPYLTDIEIDWGNLSMRDLYPAAIPDLFAEQPVILKGRYEAPGSGTITVKGKIANREVAFKLKVTLPEQESAHEGLASLWARARIEELESEQHAGYQQDVVKEITELALTYRLMSQYTAFVAVEESYIVDTATGQLRTVQVPVEMPEGVSYHGVFGQDGLGAHEAFASYSAAASPGLGAALARSTGFLNQRVQRLAGTPEERRDISFWGMREDKTSTVPSIPTLPKFTLTLVMSDPQGGQRVVELEPSGELWITQRVPSGPVTHRRLARRLKLSELREVWALLESTGMSRGTDKRFGTGDLLGTLKLTIGGHTVRWDFGAELKGSAIPADLQQLLHWFGPLEGLDSLGLSSSHSTTPQLSLPQPTR